MEKENGYVEIDLLHILNVLWKKIWWIIFAAVLGAGLAFFITVLFIPEKYQSSALFYVNNSSNQLKDTDTISTESLSAAQRLVDTYLVILDSRTTLNAVIKTANLDYTYDELHKMVKGAAKDDTGIFSVTVTSTDPKEAKLIASAITSVLPNKIASIVDVDSVHVVDQAVTPTKKSSPSNTKNCAIGLLIGVVISSAIIIILDLKDDVIRSREYLIDTYPDLPILADIPNVFADSEASTYSKYKPNIKQRGGK